MRKKKNLELMRIVLLSWSESILDVSISSISILLDIVDFGFCDDSLIRKSPPLPTLPDPLLFLTSLISILRSGFLDRW